MRSDPAKNNKLNHELMNMYCQKIKNLNSEIHDKSDTIKELETQIEELEEKLSKSSILETQTNQTLSTLQKDLHRLETRNIKLKNTLKTFKAKRDLTREEKHIRLKYDSLAETLKLISQEAKRLEERRKETKIELDKVDGLQCGICIEKPRDYVFQPCHHVYACADCGGALTRCPVCRIPLQDSFQMILS